MKKVFFLISFFLFLMIQGWSQKRHYDPYKTPWNKHFFPVPFYGWSWQNQALHKAGIRIFPWMEYKAPSTRGDGDMKYISIAGALDFYREKDIVYASPSATVKYCWPFGYWKGVYFSGSWARFREYSKTSDFVVPEIGIMLPFFSFGYSYYYPLSGQSPDWFTPHRFTVYVLRF